MFVQVRVLSYVLLANPGRMQNVSNSNTTWTIRISTGFVTDVVCHLTTTLIWDLMLNPTYQMISKYLPLFRNKKENMQILPTDRQRQRPHNKACCHENNSSIIDQRKENSNNAILMHLNINSIKNKFEDLTILNISLKLTIPIQIVNSKGYNMFRKDRAKGVGGLLVYISTTIPSLRKLTLPTSYKTSETIAVDVKIGRQDILILLICRPPNSSKKETKPVETTYKESRVN